MVNSFSVTFHGWFEAIINTYGFQLLQTTLFTFHGSGVKLPHQIPRRISFYVDIVRKLWKSRRMINLSDMISLWSQHRFHVDWILYRKFTSWK
ncbi:unnamed protein product [Rotaria sp. Silwood2]|nr:unnamed protein product [Rotaria sp. Silwood2]